MASIYFCSFVVLFLLIISVSDKSYFYKNVNRLSFESGYENFDGSEFDCAQEGHNVIYAKDVEKDFITYMNSLSDLVHVQCGQEYFSAENFLERYTNATNQTEEIEKLIKKKGEGFSYQVVVKKIFEEGNLKSLSLKTRKEWGWSFIVFMILSIPILTVITYIVLKFGFYRLILWIVLGK